MDQEQQERGTNYEDSHKGISIIFISFPFLSVCKYFEMFVNILKLK